jgi:hypothetical protein
MATIIIDEKSTGAKKMVEYLKTQRYAKVVEESKHVTDIPNADTIKAMKEAKSGKVNSYRNSEKLITFIRTGTHSDLF